MKSLVRLGLALSLLGGTVVGQTLVQPAPAVALSEADALKRLEPIPVFPILDKSGKLFFASIPNPKDKTKQIGLSFFFMNPQDAQSLIKDVQSKNADLGKDLKIGVLSLREALEIKEKNKGKSDTFVFDFPPSTQQMNNAVEVLKKNGKDVKSLKSIPVFFLTDVAGKGGLISIERENIKSFPFFFSKQDIQVVLEKFKQQNPKLANTIKIDVAPLDGVMQAIRQGKEPATAQFSLIPDEAAMRFIEEQQKASTQNNPGKKPTTPVSPTNQGKPTPSIPKAK
jgi:hypothetical protein